MVVAGSSRCSIVKSQKGRVVHLRSPRAAKKHAKDKNPPTTLCPKCSSGAGFIGNGFYRCFTCAHKFKLFGMVNAKVTVK